MKTKKEIEQLAFLEYPRLINDPYNPMEDGNTYERQIWIDAYTQCQEDNKDKKYTEEDMFKCWEACRRFERPISEGYAPNFNEFINSLNKQD